MTTSQLFFYLVGVSFCALWPLWTLSVLALMWLDSSLPKTRLYHKIGLVVFSLTLPLIILPMMLAELCGQLQMRRRLRRARERSYD